MLVVVDYGRGNLFSIEHALRSVDAKPVVSGDPETLRQASRIVFPGVGSFADAMDGLRSRELVEPLLGAIDNGVPLLGICVGCQLLLSVGEEFGEHPGLNVIPGRVRRLPATDGSETSVRIPNVGWRSVRVETDVPVVGEVQPTEAMYFVHSFAPYPANDANVAATCHINNKHVPVAVHDRSVLGVQFHPEKSGNAGLALLRRFLSWQPPSS